MNRIIYSKEIEAGEDHPEMMSEWFQNDLQELNGIGITFSEWRAIAKLKANNWKIKKGQRCISFEGIDCDGKRYRMHYLKEIQKIVNKYNLSIENC